jgi:hypothetical protein
VLKRQAPEALAGANIAWGAQLLGAAAALRSATRTVFGEDFPGEYEADVSTIRRHISEAAFADAWSRGAALSLDEAVALARQGSLMRDAVTSTT